MKSSLLPIYAITLIFLAFFSANPQIIADWRIYSFDDGTYSHAYLIPVMSAYICYLAWQQSKLELRWSWPIFVLTIAFLLLYQWLDFAHQRYVARALVAACLTMALMTTFKPNRFVLAISGFFWFVTPVWGPVSDLLQANSVSAVSYLMSFTGIPTFVHAEFVEIPAGTFEIADGCSGLRYVIAALALVSFYSVLYLHNPVSIAALVAAALAGAMITNWLRIVMLILIGHFSDMQSDIIRDHNMFGWFLFIPLMFLLFWFAEKLDMQSGDQPTPAIRSTAGISVTRPRMALLLATLLLLSGASLRLLAGMPAFSIFSEIDVETAEPVVFPVSPAPTVFAMSEYNVDAEPGDDPENVGYTIQFNGETDAQRAEFFLNDMVPKGWRVLSRRTDDHQERLIVARGSDEAVVLAAFGIGEITTGDVASLRKQRLLRALLLDRSSTLYWSFNRCEVRCESDSEDRH